MHVHGLLSRMPWHQHPHRGGALLTLVLLAGITLASHLHAQHNTSTAGDPLPGK